MEGRQGLCLVPPDRALVTGSGPSGRHSLGTPAAVWSQEGTREGGFSGCGHSAETSCRAHLLVHHRLHISEKLGLTYMSEASGGFQGLWEEPRLLSLSHTSNCKGWGLVSQTGLILTAPPFLSCSPSSPK